MIGRGRERIKLVGKVIEEPTVAIVPNGIGWKIPKGVGDRDDCSRH